MNHCGNNGNFSSLNDIQIFHKVLSQDKINFEKMSNILYHSCGVILKSTEKNINLMAYRLSPILIKYGLDNYNDYITLIKSINKEYIKEFIAKLTTHTTQFFRDQNQSDIFLKIFSNFLIMKESKKDFLIRIWCSACSTGQEAYSIAMIISKIIQNDSKWNIKFLSTDIDEIVLQKASNGKYSEQEVLSLPNPYRTLFIESIEKNNSIEFHVSKNIRSMIQFAPFNLISEKYPFKYSFDFIFCRNVLIYFTEERSKKVIKKLINSLSPDGYLFIGANETGYVDNNTITKIHTSVYQNSKPSDGIAHK